MLSHLKSDAAWDESPEDSLQSDVACRLLVNRVKPVKGCEGVAFAIEAHEALIYYANC